MGISMYFLRLHSITSIAKGSRSVYAKDVDGDGDIDILSASYYDSTIAWYENNGSENFISHTITVDAIGASSVFAIDVDNDGDMDVLSASTRPYYEGGKIEWYENDGFENFTVNIIRSNLIGARVVYAIDVDDDGDIDVLSASWWGTIEWHENDGNENFTTHTIATYLSDGTNSIFAVDVDRDGDIDVLSTYYFDDKIVWYENDGNENFISHTITTSADGAYSVYAIDVDNDGDIDVLSASRWDDKIAWYENDGSENFIFHPITFNAPGAKSVFAIDVDNDGDIDVLSASSYLSSNRITWYENDGSEIFTPRIISTDVDGAISVYATDVDGDGDIDVLSASENDHQIAWYENLLIVGIDASNPVGTPFQFQLYNNYPNPFNPITIIKYQIPEISFVTIKVYDVLGNEMAVLVNEQKSIGNYEIDFDGDELTSGIYFYRLQAVPNGRQAGSFTETKKMILLR